MTPPGGARRGHQARHRRRGPALQGGGERSDCLLIAHRYTPRSDCLLIAHWYTPRSDCLLIAHRYTPAHSLLFKHTAASTEKRSLTETGPPRHQTQFEPSLLELKEPYDMASSIRQTLRVAHVHIRQVSALRVGAKF